MSSNAIFTEIEKAYLRDLQVSSTWREIVEKLAAFNRNLPRYKPGQGDAREQELDWIYYSGVDQGTANLLKLLRNE